jgi:hypothetical protein
VKSNGEIFNFRMNVRSKFILVLIVFFSVQLVSAQEKNFSAIERDFLNPPESAKPWVFWYWLHGAISKEGITADLEAMKEVGIGGAYLMSIKDPSSAIPFQPTVRQLTPEWWHMVKFAMQEAKRLNLKLGMHVSDGFALAGGPWITPELSMQKLVWTKTYVKSGETKNVDLPLPKANENYYKDIAVFAYPANSKAAFSDEVMIPAVTASNGSTPSFLSFANDGGESFKSDTACWIQYKYPQPFTCRSIRVHVGGNNYQAQRLVVQSSNDGVNFKTITKLDPPRHGWQDTDEDVTNSIPATTATYFRFVYDKEGSAPGAEDLDAAKWKPSFKVVGIYLSDEPVINQYESKNGSIWRVSRNTTKEQAPDNAAIPLSKILNLSGKMDGEGNLQWTAPIGNWVIVRIGHTSNGHTNATGGGGKGLECDKFNPAAIRLQFDNWFAQAFEKTDRELAKQVLKVFHVDSWECGSQNWSTSFREEFKKRRGYDPMPYLLAMTGVPLQDLATSEKFLHDVRQTIADLVNDIFYVELKKMAHEKGCSFSAESVAPTMVSDGLLHYKNTDIPMGEFWLNSPTHDKPNDMLDAISGAHIYGKNIVQAEAFTSLRMNWGEHPGNLKVLGDRNFALGINKMVIHVFMHNPWMNRKPGMTLDAIGLYFQRDQTWFKQSKAWIDYLARCQSLLQMGKPVVDIAVFTGEEVPRRSVLPDRLINTLSGLFGKEKLAEEKKRLENKGQPLRTIPDGVSHSANMADPEDWIDPLNGYAYDSFNPDALMQMSVKNERVVLPGGASYAVLVIPYQHAMQPNAGLMPVAVAKKILQLIKDGATIIMSKDYKAAIGLKQKDDSVKIVMTELFKNSGKKGKALLPPYTDSSFNKLGVQKDVDIINSGNTIAWTHRKSSEGDIYFISNQKEAEQNVALSFRIGGKEPELWDAVTGEIKKVDEWSIKDGRTFLSLNLEPNQSSFIVFRKVIKEKAAPQKIRKSIYHTITGPWQVNFDKNYGGPAQPVVFNELKSWSQQQDSLIKYYSGTAVYKKTIEWNNAYENKEIWLQLDSLYNIATVTLNGVDCGTLWTRPYQIEITRALKKGTNNLEIEISNTWANRLMGDNRLPADKRVTWTTAPFRLSGKPLLPAGLVGKVTLIIKEKN